MRSFERILIYLDTDARGHPALERARRLATACGASVRAVDVLPKAPWPVRLLGSKGGEVTATLRGQIGPRLEELLAPLAQAGIATSSDVLSGKPFLALIQEVVRGGHDLVLKSARGLENLPFGSTALHLIRKCPAPVWIVREPQTVAAPGPVLAAIDPLPESEGVDVAAAILETAARVAALEQRELHVVHAWSAFGEARLRRHMAEHALASYVDEVQREVESRLTDFLASRAEAPPRERVHLVKGEPAAVIAGSAQSLGADTVVLATVARAGLPGVLIGTTAEQVLLRIGCSVLALKPPGYSPPVV